MSISDFFLQREQESPNRIYSILTGIVTDNADPDHEYRVCIRLLNRDTSDYETGFIRVATMMTGKEYGMYFLPEIGDEVLVAVEHSQKENVIREIKTKHGHTVIFHDEDDKDSIEIKTPKGLTILLDDEKEVLNFSDKNKKNKIELDSKNGILTLYAQDKISLQAGGTKLELNGDSKSALLESESSLNVKSQQVAIQAKGTLDLKSSGSVNLKSDGSANLKGAVIKLN